MLEGRERTMSDEPALRPETLAAQALGWVDEATGAVAPPIHPSTTYVRDGDVFQCVKEWIIPEVELFEIFDMCSGRHLRLRPGMLKGLLMVRG